jgi:general secretion pathway protein G
MNRLNSNYLSKNGIHKNGGFTIIELLIVIAIIGILAAYVLTSVGDARSSAYLARAEGEMENFHDAVQLYRSDHGSYPADVSRDIPSGLGPYLSSGNWPQGPWPDSVYDWDNWTINGENVYQISIRFCEQGKPDTCNFPNKDWASDFKIKSAVYYCMDGPCRSHESEPVGYPGYCVNCE